jgi:ATP-binding cassette subfamily B (MDR/TAP) protein 1
VRGTEREREREREREFWEGVGLFHKAIKGILQMSQDSQEIKTIEQWRWSEMQGLELVPPAPSDPFKTNPTTPTPTSSETERRVPEQAAAAAAAAAAQETKGMESSEPKKDSGGGASSSGEKPEAIPAVGFGDLFRFADGLDYVLMAIGSVGAIVHGCSLPIFLRFFADLVNSFGSNANNMDKMMQEVLKVKP